MIYGIEALKANIEDVKELLLHAKKLEELVKEPEGPLSKEQMNTFRKVIRKNLHHRGKTITFINGIGDGILKTAIRKESDEVLALRCSYSVGDPAVTIVTIKCPFLLLCWNPLTPYW